MRTVSAATGGRDGSLDDSPRFRDDRTIGTIRSSSPSVTIVGDAVAGTRDCATAVAPIEANTSSA